MTPSIETILKELETLLGHVKIYSTGAYPAVFLQIHSPLKIQDILDMRLSDLYYWEDGTIRLMSEILYLDEQIYLDDEARKNLAWYALQRIPVCGAKEEVLDNWLCVNRQGRPLLLQAYRKMLERASAELNFAQTYNAGYLRSLYGYIDIAHGKKTVDEVAREYRVTRKYLLNHVFRGMEIQYTDSVICQVANIRKEK